VSAPRRVARLFLLALALAGSLAAAEEKRSPKKAQPEKPTAAPTWYGQRFTHGDAGLIVAHLWSKGRKLRAETVLQGVPITTLVSGEFYYVIDGMRGTGIAVRRSAAALQEDRTRSGDRPFGTEGADLLAKGAELVREEKIAGRACKVYRLTDQLGRHEVSITDDKAALPLRIDSVDRDSGVHVVTDYVDWLREMELPDAFFEPDPRVQLVRMEYEEYLSRSSQGPVGPAPVLFGDLLHAR
jgi:hypothetical protein